MSDSLRPHESQHARPPCPSPSPGVYLNSCQLSRWCHPTIPSSVIAFSSCPQSFPASSSFPRSQLFASGGQSIGVSASASVLPMNIQDWSPLGWTGWISMQSKGLKSFLQHHSSKAWHLLSPCDLSQIIASRWWLVQRSLPGPPVIRQLVQVVAKVPGLAWGFPSVFPLMYWLFSVKVT